MLTEIKTPDFILKFILCVKDNPDWGYNKETQSAEIQRDLVFFFPLVYEKLSTNLSILNVDLLNKLSVRFSDLRQRTTIFFIVFYLSFYSIPTKEEVNIDGEVEKLNQILYSLLALNIQTILTLIDVDQPN